MEAARAIPVLLLAGGAACLVWAVAYGGATTGVVVIFPFLIGSGLAPLAGGLLLFAGLATLPLAFPAHVAPRTTGRPPAETSAGAVGTGGVILIGPVPIFLGTWRDAPRWVYLVAVGAGLVFLAAVLLWVSG